MCCRRLFWFSLIPLFYKRLDDIVELCDGYYFFTYFCSLLPILPYSQIKVFIYMCPFIPPKCKFVTNCHYFRFFNIIYFEMPYLALSHICFLLCLLISADWTFTFRKYYKIVCKSAFSTYSYIQ